MPVQTYTARPYQKGGGRRKEKREKKVKVKDEGGTEGRRIGRNYKSRM